MTDRAADREVAHDPAALDRTERRFWRDVWNAAAADAIEERGILLRTFGPIQASIVTGLPSVRMLNLVLGAADPGAVEEGHLAAAIEWVDAHDVDYYVPLTPHGEEASAAQSWLKQEGFERGYGWMKFVRDASPPDLPVLPEVEVVELAEGKEFGEIAAQGFDLPLWASALFFDLPGRDGWHCYVALVDGAAAASATLLVDDGVAEFGIAATLESARGRGCQTALLRQRILDAAAAGCHTLFVETGERTADRPSASYRNILRAGFEEAYLRPNWLRPRSS